MALSVSQIQNAYVAFFNRPADVAGLNYWSSYAGSSSDLLRTFAQQSEYTSLFTGLNNTQAVNLIYNNLFGRDADLPGLNYWVGQLANGKVTVANIADAVNKGAQGTCGGWGWLRRLGAPKAMLKMQATRRTSAAGCEENAGLSRRG